MKKILFGWIFLIGILFVACTEDKGNYTYDNSIDDVKVTVEKSYSIIKEKRDFTITPKIEMKGDKSNLSFLWLMNTLGDQALGDTASTSETLTMHINPDDADFKYKYYIRFYVTDNTTGAKAMYPIQVTIGKPYQTSWMVLHTVNRHAEIGAAQYIGDKIILVPNAYTEENGESLTGEPKAMGSRNIKTYSYWGYEAESELYVATTNPEESGLLNQSNHLKLFRNWGKLIHPVQLPDMNSNDISMRGATDYGVIFISNGKVFRGSYAPIFAEMTTAPEFTGDYYISKAYSGPTVGLGYDSKGHRFVHIQVQGEYWYDAIMPTEPMKLEGTIMKVANSSLNAADPNNIGTDKEVINILGGYHYDKSSAADWQRYAFYAYALSTTSNKSYIYVFHSRAMTTTNDTNDPCALPAFYTINTPKDVTKDTPMAGSAGFNNIIFYAAGNKVYKLDFVLSGGASTMIYQHPNPRAQIVDIKMAMESYDGDNYTDDSEFATSYGHPFSRSLGVAVNVPGEDNKETGELVILNLSSSGKLDSDGKYPSTQVHKGFGPIKNIVFI